jgi:hypothetical protein
MTRLTAAARDHHRVRTGAQIEDANGSGLGPHHEAAVVKLKSADDSALVLEGYALRLLLSHIAQVNGAIGSAWCSHKSRT